MFKLISIVLGLIAIVVAFWSPVASWVILSLPAAWFVVTYFSVRPKAPRAVPELSPQANEMIRKFGHYYAMPFGGTDLSSAASGILLASIVVAVIGCFKGFWWGLAIGAVFYVVMAFISRQFNPTNFLVDDQESLAHQEVIDWIMANNASSQRAA